MIIKSLMIQPEHMVSEINHKEGKSLCKINLVEIQCHQLQGEELRDLITAYWHDSQPSA